MRRHSVLTSFMVVFFLFVFVGGTWAGEPTQGGNLIKGVWTEPENMNPVIYPTGDNRPILGVVFSGLVKPNTQLEWEPDLAENWEISEDGKTVTFFLREDAKWHDGVSVTAHDVYFTLKSMAHPNYGGGIYTYVDPILGAAEYRKGEAEDVKGLRVIDDYTLSITTPTPNPSIFMSVAIGSIGIIPEHILGDVPVDQWHRHDFNYTPVGSGPFQITEREDGHYIRLEAFDDYFLGRPYLDNLILRFGDERSLVAAFMNQEIDIFRVPLDEASTIERLPFANLQAHDVLSFDYIGMNTLHPVFKEVEVRQAIAHALNRKEIVDSVTRGYAEVVDVPYSLRSWAYNHEVEGFAYDPDRANQMLDEAGWKMNPETGIREKDGVKMSVVFNHTGQTERRRIAAYVQENLREVGVEIEIEELDFATMVSIVLPSDEYGNPRAVTEDDFHIYTWGLSLRADPQHMEIQFHSSHKPPQGQNFVSYSNEQVDELFALARKEMDVEKRQGYFRELLGILGEEVPWIPLFSRVETSVAHEKVQNFNPSILGRLWNAHEWWIKN